MNVLANNNGVVNDLNKKFQLFSVNSLKESDFLGLLHWEILCVLWVSEMSIMDTVLVGLEVI